MRSGGNPIQLFRFCEDSYAFQLQVTAAQAGSESTFGNQGPLSSFWVPLRRRRPPDFPDADPSRSVVEDCVRSRRGYSIDGVP